MSVSKLLKALKSLKQLGNRYYQFVPETINFKEKCKEMDIDGFRLMFPCDELFNDNHDESTSCIEIENNLSQVEDEVCRDYE